MRFEEVTDRLGAPVSYLLRMAASSDAVTRSGVIEALRAVATSENPDVQNHGIEILAALPAEESSPLADMFVAWLGRDRFA